MTESLSVTPEGENREETVSARRRRSQGGSQILELSLVLLPAFMFIFLILDVAWAVYTRACLQYAVAQGVRYAVTSQTVTGLGQRASIQEVVQYNAMGRLNATSGTATGTNGWNNIHVDWFLVNSDGTLTDEDGITGGNGMQTDGQLPLVAVSVQGLNVSTFLPSIKMTGLTSKLSSITMAAVSWDRMETPPISNGGYVVPAQ